MKGNLRKRLVQIVFMFAIIFYGIFINMTANATGETTTIVLTFNSTSQNITLSVGGNNNDELLGAVSGQSQPYFIGIESSSNSQDNLKSKTINCTSATSCTVTVVVTSGTGLNVTTPGDSPLAIQENTTNITGNSTLSVAERDVPQQFNGSAYLIWSCNDKVCMKHFNFNTLTPVEGTYFIDASTIVDEIGGVETFDVNAPLKGWADDIKMANWQAAYKAYKGIAEATPIDWSTVDPEDLIGDPIDMREWEDKAIRANACNPQDYSNEDDFHACVDGYVVSQGLFVTRAQLQPVGEPQSPNSYVSYGDRQFKAIVYSDEFRALTIGSLADLDYYPAAWSNELTRQNSYDLSETTKDNPTEIATVLLEDKVNLKPLSYNGLNVASMTALDVPDNAVTVTKKTDGSFDLDFASNFYDKVVFKVTDDAGNDYYIRIKRMAVDAWISHDGEDMNVRAELYFDRTKTYTDYIITAKIVYKDGTSKIVDMVNSKRVDDGLGNTIYDYEVDEENPSRPDWPQGKGLKRAAYHYTISETEAKTVDKVYVNVEYKGSTSTSYAGAYTGSKKGELLNMSDYLRED